MLRIVPPGEARAPLVRSDLPTPTELLRAAAALRQRGAVMRIVLSDSCESSARELERVAAWLDEQAARIERL
jgi:hypothetical protein